MTRPEHYRIISGPRKVPNMYVDCTIVVAKGYGLLGTLEKRKTSSVINMDQSWESSVSWIRVKISKSMLIRGNAGTRAAIH